MKISHLWSITACFNPHSLSENSKWRSKPFHHSGANHMLPFHSHCSGHTHKSNIGARNRPSSLNFFFCQCVVLDVVVNRTWSSWRLVICVFALRRGRTSKWPRTHRPVEPISLFICVPQTRQTWVYSKISMFAHVLALSQKQTHQFIVCLRARVGRGDVGYFSLRMVYRFPDE